MAGREVHGDSTHRARRQIAVAVFGIVQRISAFDIELVTVAIEAVRNQRRLVTVIDQRIDGARPTGAVAVDGSGNPRIFWRDAEAKLRVSFGDRLHLDVDRLTLVGADA